MLGSSVDDVYDIIVQGWERTEKSNGVPYYLNHKCERTSWDHPYFEKLVSELKEMDSLKYAAYRTAIKLRHLQKRLQLHRISLLTVSKTFTQLGYQDGIEAVLDCAELRVVLSELYNASDHIPHSDVLTYVDLLQNFLLNIYDGQRTGKLNILSVKTALGCLCSGRLSEKYKFFYRQLSDSSFFISRKMLSSFLVACLQIPGSIQERKAFGGRSVTPAVDSCINMSGQGPGVSEASFLSWLLKEPQTLVWLPTMHRVAASETVKHRAKCHVCKACPLVGFRYSCLLCFNCDICQQCFLTGKTAKGHKLEHPIQEYCLQTTSKDETKAFIKTLRNQVSKKHRQKTKPKYLPVDGNDFFGVDEGSQPGGLHDEVVLREAHSIPSSVLSDKRPVSLSTTNVHVAHHNQIPGHRRPLQELKVSDRNQMTPPLREGLAMDISDSKMIREDKIPKMAVDGTSQNIYSPFRGMKNVMPDENSFVFTDATDLENGSPITIGDLGTPFGVTPTSLEDTLSIPQSRLEQSTRNTRLEQSTRNTRLEQSARNTTLEQTARNAGLEQSARNARLERSTRNARLEQTARNARLEAPARNHRIEQLIKNARREHTTRNTTLEQSPKLDTLEQSPKLDTHEQSPKLDTLDQSSVMFNHSRPGTTIGWDSVDEIDYETTRLLLSPLSSMNQTPGCVAAEAELDSLVQQIVAAFPLNVSSANVLSGSTDSPADMLDVANRVGVAMSDFVMTMTEPY